MTTSSKASALSVPSSKIESRCHCGQVILDLQLLSSDNNNLSSAFNCHCRQCRKYHGTAYTSFLEIENDVDYEANTNHHEEQPERRPSSSSSRAVSIRQGHDMIGKYKSYCSSSRLADDKHHVVERWYCKQCSSKLVSVPLQEGRAKKYYANMGPLNENTIPVQYSMKWKQQLRHPEQQRAKGERCSWVDALPVKSSSSSVLGGFKGGRMPSKTVLSGGCSCGYCRYAIKLNQPTELQHCYCQLCRQLSGGPFMTWIPIHKNDFKWKMNNNNDDSGRSNESEPPLIRTTTFGSRHMCQYCRSVLTIVYASQPNYVWPCAGGLDDETLPPTSEEMGSMPLARVCHICCKYVPSWFDLPNDGMERIPNAC
jgi:hypothetical protein